MNWQHCDSKKKAITKNSTPPTVFAAHSLNCEQTLTTKLQRASRSRIFEFASQFFLEQPKLNEKSTFSKFGKKN